MRQHIRTIGLLCAIISAPLRFAHAAPFHTIASGDWNNGAIWSPSGPPGSSDSAEIGANATANVRLTADVTVADLVLYNGELDLNGHVLSVTNLQLTGFEGTRVVKKESGSLLAGSIDLTTLDAGIVTELTIGPNDDVTANISVTNESTSLVIERDISLSGVFSAFTGATVDIGNHTIKAAAVQIVAEPEITRSPGSRFDAGLLDINLSSFAIAAGDRADTLRLFQGSATVALLASDRDGLTIDQALSIELLSHLSLVFHSQNGPGDWILRWANSSGEDRATQLLNYHAAGDISWNREDEVAVVDGGDGYTYVMIPVPEPAGCALAIVGLALASTTRRQRLASAGIKPTTAGRR